VHVRITTPQEIHALSAHLQDALAPRSFMVWDQKKEQFSMILNRYIWENNAQQRTNSCLNFSCVKKVSTQSIDHDLKQRILNLLAIRYDNGRIVFYFSDHRSLSIETDQIDIEFWDYDNAWPAENTPKHVYEYSAGGKL
jgi:hypothetical protein